MEYIRRYSSAYKSTNIPFSLKSFSPAESDSERMDWAGSHPRIVRESECAGGVGRNVSANASRELERGLGAGIRW